MCKAAREGEGRQLNKYPPQSPGTWGGVCCSACGTVEWGPTQYAPHAKSRTSTSSSTSPWQPGPGGLPGASFAKGHWATGPLVVPGGITVPVVVYGAIIPCAGELLYFCRMLGFASRLPLGRTVLVPHHGLPGLVGTWEAARRRCKTSSSYLKFE